MPRFNRNAIPAELITAITTTLPKDQENYAAFMALLNSKDPNLDDIETDLEAQLEAYRTTIRKTYDKGTLRRDAALDETVIVWHQWEDHRHMNEK